MSFTVATVLYSTVAAYRCCCTVECTVATVATVTYLCHSLGGYPGRRADVTGVGQEGLLGELLIILMMMIKIMMTMITMMIMKIMIMMLRAANLDQFCTR